jgi:hypothetical protein
MLIEVQITGELLNRGLLKGILRKLSIVKRVTYLTQFNTGIHIGEGGVKDFEVSFIPFPLWIAMGWPNSARESGII